MLSPKKIAEMQTMIELVSNRKPSVATIQNLYKQNLRDVVRMKAEPVEEPAQVQKWHYGMARAVEGF